MRLLTRAALFFLAALMAASTVWLAPAAAKPNRAIGRNFSYVPYAALLKRAVNPAGHVAYAKLKTDPRLAAVLAGFAATSPETAPALFPTRDDRLAYWINAYNLFVLAGVAHTWPARSVREDGSDAFFTQTQFVAGGKRYTLNQIEGDIIRKGFGEPRIHFTINCGSTSCPALKPAPFTGANLEKRLDEAARLFINDTRNVHVDAQAGVLWLSEIFHWYAGDFLAAPEAAIATSKPSVQAYVAHYLSGPAAQTLRSAPLPVRYLPYDWTLNADVLPVR